MHVKSLLVSKFLHNLEITGTPVIVEITGIPFIHTLCAMKRYGAILQNSKHR